MQQYLFLAIYAIAVFAIFITVIEGIQQLILSSFWKGSITQQQQADEIQEDNKKLKIKIQQLNNTIAFKNDSIRQYKSMLEKLQQENQAIKKKHISPQISYNEPIIGYDNSQKINELQQQSFKKQCLINQLYQQIQQSQQKLVEKDKQMMEYIQKQNEKQPNKNQYFLQAKIHQLQNQLKKIQTSIKQRTNPIFREQSKTTIVEKLMEPEQQLVNYEQLKLELQFCQSQLHQAYKTQVQLKQQIATLQKNYKSVMRQKMQLENILQEKNQQELQKSRAKSGKSQVIQKDLKKLLEEHHYLQTKYLELKKDQQQQAKKQSRVRFSAEIMADHLPITQKYQIQQKQPQIYINKHTTSSNNVSPKQKTPLSRISATDKYKDFKYFKSQIISQQPNLSPNQQYKKSSSSHSIQSPNHYISKISPPISSEISSISVKIFEECIFLRQEQKQYMLKTLKFLIGLPKKSKLLYKFNKQNIKDIHDFVDDRQNILIIVHLKNLRILAAFTEKPFSKQLVQKLSRAKIQLDTNRSCIFDITNKKTFLNKQPSRSIVYDPFALIWGNDAFTIRKSQPQVLYSNLCTKNSGYWDEITRTSQFLGSDKMWQEVRTYEVYCIEF